MRLEALHLRAKCLPARALCSEREERIKFFVMIFCLLAKYTNAVGMHLHFWIPATNLEKGHVRKQKLLLLRCPQTRFRSLWGSRCRSPGRSGCPETHCGWCGEDVLPGWNRRACRSCSAVPLFIGFVTAGVPMGVTCSFLISAPMVNEIALVLLYGLLGWKVAALYLGTGLFVAMLAGWVLGKLNLEPYVEDWVTKIRTDPSALPPDKQTWSDRIEAGAYSVKDIVGKVWIYVVIGIAVGAGIHGYVPEGFMTSIMGKGAWWSVPAAVVIGIPMYSNAAGIVPVVEALLGKGAALGTVLAFMMAVIALSLPEMIILRKVLKPRLILVFAGVVGLGILLVGYLFNALF